MLDQFGDFFMNLDWDRYQSSDGTVDPEKVMADQQLKAAAGDMYPRVLGALAQLNAIQQKNKRDLECLAVDERAELVTLLCGLIADAEVLNDTVRGRSIVRNVMLAWGLGGRDIVQTIANNFSRIADFAPHGKLTQGVKSFLNLVVITAGHIPAASPELYACLLADWTPFEGRRPN